MSDPLLEISGLDITFATDEGPLRAVEGVELSVEAGETVGLVGESGSGKTVTALSILGLLPSGSRSAAASIRFAGKELTTASPRELRSIRGNRISMVFQDPMNALNPVLSVGDQLLEVLRHHLGLAAAAARAEAGRLLEEVGLSPGRDIMEAHPHRLSGGMQQRVMVAMALACRPELLIADEPTTALDVTIQAQILELLGRLQAEHGMAVLFISHDLDVVARLCRRVLVMYAGQIVEAGPTDALFREPRHPYTRGLLDARPRLTGPRGAMRALSGSPPSPLAWPTGCRFRPRCDHAAPPCQAPPSLDPVGPTDRKVRCLRHQELGPLLPETTPAAGSLAEDR